MKSSQAASQPNASREHLLAEFYSACVILTLFACITLAARCRGGRHSAPAPTLRSHIKFLSFSSSSSSGHSRHRSSSHCTALRAPATPDFASHSASRLNVSTAIARRLVQHAQRAHLSHRRRFSLKPWRRCHSVSEDHTSSSPGYPSPRTTAHLLAVWTPSNAATSFHFGPSLHLNLHHNVVLHIITRRPVWGPNPPPPTYLSNITTQAASLATDSTLSRLSTLPVHIGLFHCDLRRREPAGASLDHLQHQHLATTHIITHNNYAKRTGPRREDRRCRH